ncbi:MAG: SCO family protein [Bdellovibrionaceae bacterium]|nr:SCO family protein [Pseudobdellovibrionaceae bacterium]
MVFVFLFLLLFTVASYSAHQGATDGGYDGKPAAAISTERPKELDGVGIEEKLGSTVDMDLKFKNEKGEDVTLGSFYDGRHPVIISLVYYSCPGLCNFHLNGLVEGLKGLDWSPGEKFQVLAISFDAKETPDLGAGKKKSYMDVYERPQAEKGFHFLTADQATIDKITSSVGFKFKWNETEKEWAHSSAAIVTTPKGIISRYLGGIMFDPKDVKLALNEATEGKIGTFVDKMILYCFHYDPKENKYSLAAFNLVRLGGVGIVVILMLLLLPFWLRNRKREGTTGR